MKTRPEITGRKIASTDPGKPDDQNSHDSDDKKLAVPDIDRDAFSVPEFCAKHGIALSTFYEREPHGEMPDTFFIGARRLVSKEAAKRWRRDRELAAPKEAAAKKAAAEKKKAAATT